MKEVSFKGFHGFYGFLVSIRKRIVKAVRSWSLGCFSFFFFFYDKGETKASVNFFN